MTVLSMQHFVDRDLIPILKELGRYEWLHLLPQPDSSELLLLVCVPEELSRRYRTLGATLGAMTSYAQDELLHLYAYSKLLVCGPKLLRPTAEQCDALENVEVNVPLEEYQQPFPAFLVELPSEYRKSLSSRLQYDAPRFALLCHHRERQQLLVTTGNGLSQKYAYGVFSPSLPGRKIEDHFALMEENAEAELSRAVDRVAINFSLLLTGYGVRDLGPVDPIGLKRKLRQIRSKKDRKYRERRILDSTINLISFEQEVVFYQHSSKDSSTDQTGLALRPHWRRGHFKRVAYGFQRSERRLAFIPPCLVNAGRYQGDVADTSYALKAPRLGTNSLATEVPGGPGKPR